MIVDRRAFVAGAAAAAFSPALPLLASDVPRVEDSSPTYVYDQWLEHGSE